METNSDDHKNRLGFMMTYLVVAWLALIGAERIDFFNGSGSFVLTPFLILSPLIIIIGLVWASRRDTDLKWNFNIPSNILLFVLAVIGFLILNLLSIIFGLDVALGARRFVLLSLILIYSTIIFILMTRLKNSPRILAIGAYAGLGVYIFFCVMEFINWLTGALSNLPFVNFAPATIGPFAPRVSGMSIDPNRGGMLVVVYMFILIVFAPRSRLRTVAIILSIILLLLSMSKTALIAFVVLLLVLSFQNPGWTRKYRRTIFNSILGIAVITFLIFHIIDFGGPETPFDFKEAVNERLAVGEDRSGGIHLALLKRGFEISFLSIKNLLLGIGFGSSHVVLNDYFPGNKYANFHSGYLSILVESGLLSLCLFVFFYFFPAFNRKRYLPLILSVASFSLFYQLTLDPFFWFCLLLFWNNFGFTGPATKRETAQ